MIDITCKYCVFREGGDEEMPVSDWYQCTHPEKGIEYGVGVSPDCSGCVHKEIKHNCDTCIFLRNCDELKKNAEYQAMKCSEAWKYEQKHVCGNYKCAYIEYPIEVSGIDCDTEIVNLRGDKPGSFAAVRPCGDEKTYLGLLLGDMPLGIRVSYDEKTKRLKASFDTNPAILVPELGKIVWGCGSWWHKIKSADDLKVITQTDMDNVWYVKALKEMGSAN